MHARAACLSVTKSQSHIGCLPCPGPCHLILHVYFFFSLSPTHSYASVVPSISLFIDPLLPSSTSRWRWLASLGLASPRLVFLGRRERFLPSHIFLTSFLPYCTLLAPRVSRRTSFPPPFIHSLMNHHPHFDSIRIPKSFCDASPPRHLTP